jgi:hypothetical protein
MSVDGGEPAVTVAARFAIMAAKAFMLSEWQCKRLLVRERL